MKPRLNVRILRVLLSAFSSVLRGEFLQVQRPSGADRHYAAGASAAAPLPRFSAQCVSQRPSFDVGLVQPSFEQAW